MTLDPAMVGRPRTTSKSSAHHKREETSADAPTGTAPDRLTPLRHTKPANGRVVHTHYHKRMGFATPRHRPTLGESRGAAGVVSGILERASVSSNRPARRERRRL